MGNFDKGAKGGFSGGRSAGRSNFGGRSNGARPSFGGRDDRGPVTMHKVNCSECGKIAEVPFKPTGDKPVFCNNCFGDRRESPTKRFDTRFDKKSISNPGYVSNPRTESKSDPRINELKAQIESLHNKIDRILEMVKREVQVLDIKTTQSPKPKPAPVRKSVSIDTTKKVAVKKVTATPKVKKAIVKKALKK